MGGRRVLAATLVFVLARLAAAADPVPDIKANGSDGSISLAPGSALSITVSLAPGSLAGSPADWWLAADTPFGWYHFSVAAGWAAGLSVAHEGPLFALPNTAVLGTSDLPEGTYGLYFGVDTAMNGQLDMGQLYYDRVDVTIGSTASRLQPSDFQYLGAFRLPGGPVRPRTFDYGGEAMTFNPNGNPGGAADGHPGSLFIMGHTRLPYGELPNGNQVAETTIPIPVASKNLASLNRAPFLQEFRDVAQGLFPSLDEIVRAGMAYLDCPATGPKIHLAWGQHLQDDPSTQVPSHAWFDPDLATPSPRGTWYIGNQSLYSVNGYLFEIPTAWADAHAAGRYLATGRYRDGGWSGQGPALFAYRPWIDGAGTPAPSGTRLPETVLLRYESSTDTEDVVSRALRGYQHADEWEGGAWITTSTGKTAVLFAGTKGTGAKYWYGWVNPAGPDHPCVETEFLGQFPLCRLADGTPCPPSDLGGCTGHSDYRGWWSSRFTAQLILYDPADLARVAAGQMQPWQPQPYAAINIDDRLLLNPSRVEEEMLGTGVQRRFRIGDVAYDRAHDLLYVLELFADSVRPIVHVWRVR